MNRHRVFQIVVLLILVLGISTSGAFTTGNPDSLKIRLFKTELYNGANWVAVFDNSASTLVDLVANPRTALGRGDLATGTYTKIRFTLENGVLYSGTNNTCAGPTKTATDAPFFIYSNLGPTAQVTLTFATAAAGGGTSWYSNGSDTNPLVMTGAVQVQSGQTTNVGIQFSTRDTLVFDNAGDVTLARLTINVISHVVGSTTFTGGDYWVMHYRAALNTDFLDRNPDGTLIPPNTEDEWALVRQYTHFISGWGFKFRFAAPDASGNGTATIVADGIEHRHRVDQTGCTATDCGIINPAGAGDMVLAYTISADNRLTITEPGGTGVFWGAFSRDHNTLIGVNMEGGNDGQEIVMGVKVATAEQTMTGLYAWNGYGAEFNYPIASGVTGTVASRLSISGQFGWTDIASPPDGVEYSSNVSINDPALTSASANAATSSFAGGGPGFTSITTGPDGSFTVGTGEGLWLASPDGIVAIVASGTNDIDSDHSPSTDERHYLG